MSLEKPCKSETRCKYRGPNGETCSEPAEFEGLCFWHDSSQKKQQPDLVEKLEARARTGEPMIGFSLRYADLEGVNLVCKGANDGYKLQHCDLYRANLRRSHLFHLDLEGTSLMKADLTGANLNCANLSDSNLLGVILAGTKLDNIHWDKLVLQEKVASENEGNREAQQDYYEQAEEIYRNLRRTNEAQGLFENAGYFFKREMIMRRYQLPKYSTKRVLSKIVDMFCGYGEEPARVVMFSMLIILSFAVIYSFIGITDGDQVISLSSGKDFFSNFENLMRSIYFSIVTFTTLGYGDLAPVGWTRAFAAIEAFIGSFTLALFVVVFVKKMTR